MAAVSSSSGWKAMAWCTSTRSTIRPTGLNKSHRSPPASQPV
jgi:hypothetical protein